VPDRAAALARTIPFDVTALDQCAGARALCTHDTAHPCRPCHVAAFAVLASVRAYRADVHGAGPDPAAPEGADHA
jgi:hypothetical protein